MVEEPVFTVVVRLFAIYRERLGAPSLELALPAGATVRQALEELGRRHPRVAALVPNTMVAVNQEYVDPDHPLRPGDELAVIPPVSGGAGTGRRGLARRGREGAAPASGRVCGAQCGGG